MRHDDRTHGGFTARTLAAGVPVALAGSIALALSGAPANATDNRAEERMLRAHPASADRPHGIARTVRVTGAATPATYTVVAGDTVTAIASRFGLRAVDVLTLNGLNWGSIIYPGQVLRLVGTAAAAPAKHVAATPSTASRRYTIKAGDTVSTIAHRFGVAVQAVLRANKLGWSSVIYPGHTLVIPGKSGAATTAAASKPRAQRRSREAGRRRNLHGEIRRHDQLDRAPPRRLRAGSAEGEQARMVVDHLPRREDRDPAQGGARGSDRVGCRARRRTGRERQAHREGGSPARCARSRHRDRARRSHGRIGHAQPRPSATATRWGCSSSGRARAGAPRPRCETAFGRSRCSTAAARTPTARTPEGSSTSRAGRR